MLRGLSKADGTFVVGLLSGKRGSHEDVSVDQLSAKNATFLEGHQSNKNCVIVTKEKNDGVAFDSLLIDDFVQKLQKDSD